MAIAILLLSSLTFSKLVSLPITIIKTASATNYYKDCPDFWIGPDCHKGGDTKGGETGGGICDDPDSSFIKGCHKGGGTKGGETGGTKCNDDHCKPGKHKGDDKPPKANPKSSISPPQDDPLLPLPSSEGSSSQPTSDPPSTSFIPFLIIIAIIAVAIMAWKATHRNKNRSYREITRADSNYDTHQVIIGVVTKGGIKI